MLNRFFNDKSSEENFSSLKNGVLEQNGKVSGREARQFIHHALYEFGEEDGKAKLTELPLDVRLNLYRAIAQGDLISNRFFQIAYADKAKNLDALGISMGLFDKDFAPRQAEVVRDFLSSDNKENLEKKWQEESHFGTFQEAMKQGFQGSLSATNQKVLCEFIVQTYAEHAGLGRVKVDFFSQDADENGKRTEGGIRRAIPSENADFVLSMNEKSFGYGEDFLGRLNTVMHELEHGRQFKLVDKLEGGEIKEADPDYQDAQIYAIGLGDKGHIINGNKDFEFYKKQPHEVGARWVGAFAAHKMLMEYGEQSSFNADLSMNRSKPNGFDKQLDRLIKDSGHLFGMA